MSAKTNTANSAAATATTGAADAAAAAGDEELRAIQQQFRELGARATASGADAAALREPASMFPFYNRFMTLCMELDRRMGTKELLAAHGDLIKAVRATLKKCVPSASAGDKLTLPLRLAAWTGVMFMSCLQIILLMPVLMPVEWVLKFSGLRAWSPFNFLAFVMTRCATAAQGIVVHIDVPAGARKEKHEGAHKGSIVTYNHVANLDPFATFLGSPAQGTNCFLGKKTLFLLPFLGWAMMLVGNIPINRSGREKAQRMVTEASQTAIVKRRYAVVIAPEGTRSWDGHLSVPMKKGTFHIQRATRAAILPVVLHGAYELWPRGTAFPRTGEITLRRLRTIPFNASHTHDEVRLQLQRQYLDALYPTTRAGVQALPSFKRLSWGGALKCLFLVALFAFASGVNLTLLRLFYQAVLGVDMYSLRFLGLFAACNLAQILYIKFKH